PGVSDALARELGVAGLSPLAPKSAPALDKWAVMVPATDAEAVRRGMFAAGAGRIGDYDSCSWSIEGDGQFRPLDGADPTIGSVGALEHVRELRVEMVAERRLRERVRSALYASHPYEEPAYDLLEPAAEPSGEGLGRVGELGAPVTLAEFAERVAAAPPTPAWGASAAG